MIKNPDEILQKEIFLHSAHFIRHFKNGLKRMFWGRSLSPLDLSIENDDGCKGGSQNFDF